MHDHPRTSSHSIMSITPRKKSVRFNITTSSPRSAVQSTPRSHPLNVSYTIPTSTVNIDHITTQSHLPNLNDHVEYIPTARRNQLHIRGEQIRRPSTQTLDELRQFMKYKADNIRENMTKMTSTFEQASTHLHELKDG
jgi:hypothetical protein